MGVAWRPMAFLSWQRSQRRIRPCAAVLDDKGPLGLLPENNAHYPIPQLRVLRLGSNTGNNHPEQFVGWSGKIVTRRRCQWRV